MARPENPITAAGPVPEFAQSLRELRHAAGTPPYRQMARDAHYSAPALSMAASGKRLPSWQCVEAYLRACGVESHRELEEWKLRWSTAKTAHRPLPRTRRTGSRPAPTPFASSTSNAAHPHRPSLPRQKTSNDLDLPNPQLVHTWTDLALGLDAIRTTVGLSYRRLAARARTLTPEPGQPAPPTLALSSISEVLTRRRKPTLKWMLVYLNACGLAATDAIGWANTFRRISREDARVRRAQRALNAVTEQEAEEELADTAEHNRLVEQVLEELAKDDPQRQTALEAMARSKNRPAAPPPRHRRTRKLLHTSRIPPAPPVHIRIPTRTQTLAARRINLIIALTVLLVVQFLLTTS